MEITEGWVKDDGTVISNVKEYILNQIKERKVSSLNNFHDLEIIIGTDAMIKNRGRNQRYVSFMTVIVFKKGNTGSHIINRRFNKDAKGYIPTIVKLQGEIERTSELAFWFRENIELEPEIHLDLNTDPEFGSYETYKYVKGYFENCGFKSVKYKPEAPCASIAADHYL